MSWSPTWDIRASPGGRPQGRPAGPRRRSAVAVAGTRHRRPARRRFGASSNGSAQPARCGHRRWRCGLRLGRSQRSRRPGRAHLGQLHPGPLRPPLSDADQALRDRLDALHALSQAHQSISLDGPETDQKDSSRPEDASEPLPHGSDHARLAGGRDRARTCDLVVVSDALWPAELHARTGAW
jgi:hypothetical protein